MGSYGTIFGSKKRASVKALRTAQSALIVRGMGRKLREVSHEAIKLTVLAYIQSMASHTQWSSAMAAAQRVREERLTDRA